MSGVGDGYVPLAGFEIEETKRNGIHEREHNPSDFFRGERRPWQPPTDLDNFFQRVYLYHCNRGFICTIVQWFFELLTLGFTIAFSALLLLFIDWKRLLSARCGAAAIDAGHPPCNLLEEAFFENPFRPLTISKLMTIAYLTVFSFYWLFCLLKFFIQFRELLEIRHFCHQRLQLREQDVQTMSWSTFVDRIVSFQKEHRLCFARDLTALDIVSRIMRRQNYLIAMLNRGVLATNLPAWMPGVGPASGGERAVIGHNLLMTKTVEWSIDWCILHHMFDRNFRIRSDFLTSPESMRGRMKLLSVSLLLLSPFISLFLLLRFTLRYAQLFYQQPAMAGLRAWSNLARWKFREFNELDHQFCRRLNASYFHAINYCNQFPSPILSIVGKFLSFVAGAFAAVLLAMGLADETLLEAQLAGRNLLWYAAILGTVITVSRSLITDENVILDPESCLRRVVKYTHYLPKHWRNRGHFEEVRAEFDGLFQYKARMFLEEMLSVLVTPMFLWLFLSNNVEAIIDFVKECTVYVDGVGHVCSLSVFDFDRHGNPKYGSPAQAPKDKRSSQGKMEKSFVGFSSEYPSWQPGEAGRRLLAGLETLRITRMPSSALHSCHGFKGSDASHMRSSNGSLPQNDISSIHNLSSADPGSLSQVQLEASVNYEQVDKLFWLDQMYMSSAGEGAGGGSHGHAQNGDQSNDCPFSEARGGHGEDAAVERDGGSLKSSTDTVVQFGVAEDMFSPTSGSHLWMSERGRGSDSSGAGLLLENPGLSPGSSQGRKDSCQVGLEAGKGSGRVLAHRSLPTFRSLDVDAIDRVPPSLPFAYDDEHHIEKGSGGQL